MKRIFVTGGRGRMGGDLIPRLEGLGWHVTAPQSREVSILERSQLEDALKAGFDVVLHLAAYTDVGQAEIMRDECWATNVIGTRNVAQAAAAAGARLVHFSSDYVFDGERGSYTESDAPCPSNYYSLTKAVAEESARLEPGALIVRTSFKDAVWKYPVAFQDQFTSADYTDVIAGETLNLLEHLDSVQESVLHVATERKSIYELATRRNPAVQPGTRASAKVHIPPDVSLDVSRWEALKSGWKDAEGRALRAER
jgi:dTDP-4-dehydrorhamnose reductase